MIESLDVILWDKKVGTLVANREGHWKSHATLTLLATQDCPLWLQYD